MRGRAAWLSCVCCLACSGSPFHGGYARPEGALPGDRKLASFVPRKCQDPTHAEHAARFSSVDLVQTQAGRSVLLEHRQGHALLVAENFHDEGAFRVFEVVVAGDHLRRWRIPRSGVDVGSVDVGRQLTEVRRGERFEAGLASSHLSCALVPQRAELALGAD